MLTKSIIENYFNAEKQESFLFMGIGIAAFIIASICFFYLKTPFTRGLAIPLILVGLLLGIVGYNVYAKSDKDRINIVYRFDMNPQELKTIELPRLTLVMKNFVVYRYTEISLLIIGLALFSFFKNNLDNQFYCGIGLGLTIMACCALLADYFAEKRGQIYFNALKEFLEQMS